MAIVDTNHISSLHHITICTGTAQGDIDFFVQVLGQRFVKRTLFYDGSLPIYHLYFADALGTPGTVMTTFPTRRTGLQGRKGSTQFTVCTYSIPTGLLEWWIGQDRKRVGKGKRVSVRVNLGGRGRIKKT